MPSCIMNGIEICHSSVIFPIFKQRKTNYEKIKTMSINEMAKFLAYSECRICTFNQNKKCSSDKGVGQCHKGIKIWLEQESEEE